MQHGPIGGQDCCYLYYAQCGHTTCGSDLWLPGMSEGECGAGAVDQGCRVQEECSGGGCRAGVQSADFQSVVLTSTLAQAATIYRGHEGNQPDIT